MGAVRSEIDEKIKELLYLREYRKEDVRIDPSYPLSRIDVSYQNSMDRSDSFLVEVGYIRRIPILKQDQDGQFVHLAKGERFQVNTPRTEELFANKLGACLYRTSPGDVYDVYRISREAFDRDVFRKCLVIDTLTRGRPPVDRIEVDSKLGSVSIDSHLRNLLRDGANVDFRQVIDRASDFAEEIINELTLEERSLIRQFYDQKSFEPGSIDDTGIFHKKLPEHPAIMWAMKNL